MSCEVLELPSDVKDILALLAEKDGEIARLTREAERQQARLQALQEQINLLIAKRFGRSSEKLSADQPGSSTRPKPRRPPVRNQQSSRSGPSTRSTRTKAAAGSAPANRCDTRFPAEERICAHDGEGLVEIGEEISEQFVSSGTGAGPLQRAKKYACPHCQLGVKTAPLPPQPLPKTMASPGSWRISRSRSTRMPCRCIGRSTS